MKQRHAIGVGAALLGCLLVLSVALASAGNASMEWWVFGSGGAPSSGGAVTMNDTLGQPIIGPSSGGDISLKAGYWYEAAALPQLAVSKAAQPTDPMPQQPLTYSVVVSNHGDAEATGVVVSDTLPAEVTFSGPVTLDPPGAGTTGTPPIVVSDATVAASGSMTVTFPVNVNTSLPPGTLITNTAAVSSTEVTTPLEASVAVAVANAAPILGTVDPDSGSGPVEVTTYFATTFHDANGWQDLKQCYFHIGRRKSLVGNVTLFYQVPKNEVRLRTDDGKDWSDPCEPEGGGVLENSQAIVYCDQVVADPSADSLTLHWAILFKSGYSGEKKLGMKAKDLTGDKAKGQWKGLWTIIE